MALTSAQLQAFADDIDGNTDQTVIDALAAGSHNTIRNWYNQEASPAFYVFLTSVDTDTAFKSIDKSEYIDVPASGGTTVESLVEAIEAASLARRQEVALQLLLANGTYDPSVQANREALVEIFPNTMPNTRAAFLADAVRQANYIEKLFATEGSGPAGGDGSSANDAAIPGYEGNVTTADVDAAVALIGG